MISFKFKVASVGPDAFEEKVTRASGKVQVAAIPCRSVELISEDESAGTIALWLTTDQIEELFGKDNALQVDQEVEVSFAASLAVASVIEGGAS